ncbi:MAG: serine hydrolase domain-containing protein [Candidatus Wallbacteria bacterium]
MKKLSLILLVAALVSFAAFAAEAKSGRACDEQRYQNTITAARETLWKAITTGKGASAAVAVMDGGRIVYSEGIGAADRAKNRPVGKNTRFNIASVSKAFLAAAIMLLVDEGRVALDEKVVKYLPEFTMKDLRYKDITVRMLLNHSSGLPGATYYLTYGPDYTMQKLLIETMKDASLKHAPGAMSIYCNDGFTLAEMIVERVSGMNFVDFVTERIFKPLGMKDSGVGLGEGYFEDIAEFYDLGTGDRYPPEAEMVYAGGGFSSTVEDLCRFGASFGPFGRVILSKSSLEEIRRTQPTAFSGKLKCRQIMSELGWDYSSLPYYAAAGYQVLTKGGNSISYATNLQIIPDLGISVAVCITGMVAGESLTRPILDALMKDKKLMEPEPKPVLKPEEPQAVPEELLGYAGYYVNDTGVMKVEFDADKKGFGIYRAADKDGAKKEEQRAEPVMKCVYNGGFFHNFEKGAKYYFTTVDGTSYLVMYNMPVFGADFLKYQKLPELKNPVSLKIGFKGKKWLYRNLRPNTQRTMAVLAESNTYDCLPGYVDFVGIKKIETPDYAGMAATAFRDQTDLRLFEHKGETWLKCSLFIFSPEEKVRKLLPETNIAVINAENHNEWLKAEKDAVVKFERPRYGRIVVTDGETALYDSILCSPEYYGPGRKPGSCAPESVFVPAGSYILCAGKAGDVFKILVK